MEIVPTSMIDISDGLSSEILHICTQSKVGCKIFEDKLPFHPETQKAAEEFNIDPTICAMSGGEDYELLFTINPDDYNKIKGSPYFAVVGHITEAESGCNLLTRDGSSVQITAQGWNALLK